MSELLLIETRDPFADRDVDQTFLLAEGLARDHRVTLFLLENGVLAARETALTPQLVTLAKAGVKVLADDFSLRERGVTRVAGGVTPSPIDTVIDFLARGLKVLWH